MSSETEKAKWIRLIKQVQDNPAPATDWKGISEITQIGMYVTVALFAGVALTGLTKTDKKHTTKTKPVIEVKSGSTSRTAKEEAI